MIFATQTTVGLHLRRTGREGVSLAGGLCCPSTGLVEKREKHPSTASTLC